MSSNFKCVKFLEWITDLPSKECPQESPVFLMNGNKWFFQFTLEGQQDFSYNNFCFKVYLVLKSKKSAFKLVSGRYYVGFKTEEPLSLGKGTIHVPEIGQNLIWVKIMDTLHAELPSNYMAGNKIKFLFSFDNVDESVLKIVNKTVDKAVQLGSLESYLKDDLPPEGLSKDFSSLLDADLNSDVDVKCGDQSIKAHKIILCARSDVLKAMLQSDMLESRIGMIEIQDMDVSCFRDFFRYLYTDVMPELTFQKAVILYETGDKYAVRSLMLRCSEYLKDNLSLENVYECLALADAHSDKKLKDRVMSYILDEKVYLRDEYWLPFCENFPKEVIEIYKMSYKNDQAEQED